MKRFFPSKLLLAVISIFVLVYPGSASAKPLQAGALDSAGAQGVLACTPSWSQVSSPNGSGDDNILGDVQAISPTDIWAVGNTGSGLNPLSTLTEHYDGTAWSVVPSPNGVFPVNSLAAVSAISSSDVWAVGYSDNGSVSDNQVQTLTMHWDGNAWSLIPSPNTRRPVNQLFGVVAVATNDVWAVGISYDYSVYRTMIMHWNGTSWRFIASPSPGSSANFLYSVDAVSATDIWAVGTQSTFLEQTLVLHWNGTSWSVVTSPNIGTFGNNILEVDVVSASDIWAAGYHQTVVGFSQPYQTSIFHYDGSSWSIVDSPNNNQLNNYLFDIVGIASNDAWAVGFYDTGVSLNSMVQHWDGTSWTIQTSVDPGSYFNQLVGVDALSSTDVWAVGNFTDGLIGVNTLVEHYSTDCPLTIHVASITPSFRTTDTGFQVRAAITIQDASGAAAPGAAVTVVITLPDGRTITRTRTTGTNGRATVSVSSNQTGLYVFTVTNVSLAGWTYDPSANTETSDSITVP